MEKRKYGQWSEENLQQAIAAYKNGDYGLNECSRVYVQKRPQKIVGLKGKLQVGTITSGERGVNTTMVVCVNAAGVYAPPMIIFKRKRWNDDLKVGAPSGSLVTISDTVGNAVSAFQHSGIWPVNRHVFKDSDFAPADALVTHEATPTAPGHSRSSSSCRADENVTSVTPSAKSPDTSKDNFTKALIEISPLPAPNFLPTRKRTRDTGAQKATVLTSSPYKSELEASKNKNKLPKKEQQTKKALFKDTKGTVNKRVTFMSQNKTLTDQSWLCEICEMETEEDMIQCMYCRNWYHTVCAGVSANKKIFYCINCK
ncbi:hypothetical protein J6590_105382 [Homalodisca vitripennis]|nr:hypothetical protein J6590_105382 [Homalodisca vitripennis]